MEQQNLDDSTSVYNMVYWDPLLEKKKKDSFDELLLIDNEPGPQQLWRCATRLMLPSSLLT